MAELPVTLLQDVADWLSDLLEGPLPKSDLSLGVLDLPPDLEVALTDSGRLGVPEVVSREDLPASEQVSAYRQSWNRIDVPVFSDAMLQAPVATVGVPDSVTATWEAPSQLPQSLPAIRMDSWVPTPTERGIIAGSNLSIPQLAVHFSTPPLTSKDPNKRVILENNRKRRDSKIPGQYGRAASLLHGWHKSGHFHAFQHGVFHNWGHPHAQATAVAINHAYARKRGYGRFSRDPRLDEARRAMLAMHRRSMGLRRGERLDYSTGEILTARDFYDRAVVHGRRDNSRF